MCPACIGSTFLLLSGAGSAGGLALIAASSLPHQAASQGRGGVGEPERTSLPEGARRRNGRSVTTTVRVPPLGQVVPTDLSNAQNYEYLYATTQDLRYVAAGNAVAIAVPEPSTFLSLGIGVAALLLAAVRGSRRM